MIFSYFWGSFKTLQWISNTSGFISLIFWKKSQSPFTQFRHLFFCFPVINFKRQPCLTLKLAMFLGPLKLEVNYCRLLIIGGEMGSCKQNREKHLSFCDVHIKVNSNNIPHQVLEVNYSDLWVQGNVGNLTEDFKVCNWKITGILVNVVGRNFFQKAKKKNCISRYNFAQSKFLLIQLEIHKMIFFFFKN